MSTPTVLVVDDDDSIREIAQMALELVGGWHVLSADGGVSALELARAHHPDAVLMDVMMPDMDGLTAFAEMQRDASTSDIPVILVTAKVLVGRSQMWDDLPISGVIAKPFDPMTLAADVSELLGWTA